MTYPQSSSEAVAKAAGDIFRVNTLISTAGDIYESNQSAHAFTLGPDSDISKVEVTYYDDQAPDHINQFTLSPGRAWHGRINARLDATYDPAGRPGRILIRPAEIFNADYRPAGFNPAADTIEFFTPRLDVIQFLRPQGDLLFRRSDREFLFERMPIPLGSLNIVLPFYGRRYASFLFTNHTVALLSGSILGVNFGIGDNTGGAPRDQEDLLAPLSIAAGVTDKAIVRASVDGMFDAILIQVSFPAASTGPLATRITFSDTEV